MMRYPIGVFLWNSTVWLNPVGSSEYYTVVVGVWVVDPCVSFLPIQEKYKRDQEKLQEEWVKAQKDISKSPNQLEVTTYLQQTWNSIFFFHDFIIKINTCNYFSFFFSVPLCA